MQSVRESLSDIAGVVTKYQLHLRHKLCHADPHKNPLGRVTVSKKLPIAYGH
jgi:hypothetical protein